MSTAPKVFLSHASEDKDRFVLPFAQALRESGVDVWVEKWEMNPGDSLTDRIFEEGIGNADAFIVVVSATSVTKRWVREELNAALVERISKGTRLIPVVLDNAEVPVALRSTLWEAIADPNDFDQSVRRIVATLFGHSTKPALGPAPAYVSTPTPSVPGISRLDVIVLQHFGARAVEKGDTLVLETERVWNRLEDLGISREDYLDSCSILSRQGYLEATRQLAPVPQCYSITLHGFESYLLAFDPAYSTIVHSLGFAVVNDESIKDNLALAG